MQFDLPDDSRGWRSSGYCWVTNRFLQENTRRDSVKNGVWEPEGSRRVNVEDIVAVRVSHTYHSLKGTHSRSDLPVAVERNTCQLKRSDGVGDVTFL